MLFEVAGNWIEAVIPLYAQDAATLTPSGVGALFAYAAALTVGLQMLVSRLVEARSALWLAVGAGLATILAFALLAASPAMLTLIGAVSLCSIAQMLVGPLVPTAVNALAPPARRASYMVSLAVNIAVMGFILASGVLAHLSTALPDLDPSQLRHFAGGIAAGNPNPGLADSVVHNALRNGFGWVMLYGGIGVWMMAAISFVSFNVRPVRTEVQCPD